MLLFALFVILLFLLAFIILGPGEVFLPLVVLLAIIDAVAITITVYEKLSAAMAQ